MLRNSLISFHITFCIKPQSFICAGMRWKPFDLYFEVPLKRCLWNLPIKCSIFADKVYSVVYKVLLAPHKYKQFCITDQIDKHITSFDKNNNLSQLLISYPLPVRREWVHMYSFSSKMSARSFWNMSKQGLIFHKICYSKF